MTVEFFCKAMFNLIIISLFKTLWFCSGGKVKTGLERAKKSERREEVDTVSESNALESSGGLGDSKQGCGWRWPQG